MTCPSCGSENRAERRFCTECGARLAPACPACGARIEGPERFCGECGARLSGREAPGSADREHSQLPAGERRQLTVMFCDLVGSTPLSSELDPEEFRDVVMQYHRTVGTAVAEFGGHVASLVGDGLLVYFGWPQAHDDAAARAVRAGLAILGAVDELGQRLRMSLQVRIGIHTGGVVISEDGNVFGETPNAAARIQTAAEPDTVVISAATHRLVSGLFVVEERGPCELKGMPRPIELYRVVQPSGVRSRLAAAAVLGLTLFVDRREERRLLQARFEQAREGEGQLVLIAGEPGIGKSRLARTLQEDLSGVPHTWLESGGQPYFADTPFFAVTELLKQFFQWTAEDDADARVGALDRALGAAGLDPQQALPLVAPLLDLAAPRSYVPVLAAPDVARRRLLATLAAWTFGTARLQPLVILLEDLQWVDASTLALQQLLVEQGAAAPILLIHTARPEFRPPWAMRANHAHVTLGRLRRDDVREMVTQVAARVASGHVPVEMVVDRTDGVPLFVEELTKAVVEAGGAAAKDIPTTLADSLMARLDRLGPLAKEVARVGALLGREFPYSLLRAVHPVSESNLEGALAKLADAELLYVHGYPPESTYVFKHALVQDVAYGSLLKGQRRALHARAAQIIVDQFPELSETKPELLAHHHTEAGEAEAAAAAWLRAGERAIARGALGEGVGHMRRGMAVLSTLPEGPARSEAEFRLQVAFGLALGVVEGYGSSAAAEVLERARALGEGLGNPIQVVMLIGGLWVTAIIQKGPLAGQPLADQALAAAERSGIAPAQVWPHFQQLLTRFYRADLPGARRHGDRALALYDEATAVVMTMDPRAATLGFAALTAWQLGLIDEARTLAHEGVEWAERGRRPIDRAWAEQQAAWLYVLRREPAEARRHAEQALAACAEESIPTQEALALMRRGWAIAEMGAPEEGIAVVRDGIERLLATGQRLSLEFSLGLLADAQARAGDIAGALVTLAEAEGAVPGEDVWRADTLRRRAELRALLGHDAADVEATFRDALAVARKQGARVYELRIATAYARFLREHRRASEARALLAPAYAALTEGFDTPDLTEARQLLEEVQ
jgi:class 3 adenylate cyclase/tetratricopeptide (TPR) repeat protein